MKNSLLSGKFSKVPFKMSLFFTLLPGKPLFSWFSFFSSNNSRECFTVRFEADDDFLFLFPFLFFFFLNLRLNKTNKNKKLAQQSKLYLENSFHNWKCKKKREQRPQSLQKNSSTGMPSLNWVNSWTTTQKGGVCMCFFFFKDFL